MKRDQNKPSPGIVWEGDGVRLIIGEAPVGPVAIYALHEFDGGKYGRQEWRRVDGTARALLSEVVRDFGHVPGLSALLSVLPDDPALASKAYWRVRAEKAEEDMIFEDAAIAWAARYRALEHAAILERGCFE